MEHKGTCQHGPKALLGIGYLQGILDPHKRELQRGSGEMAEMCQ